MKNQLKQSPLQTIKQGHYLYYFYYWCYSLIHDYNIAGHSLSATIFNKKTCYYPAQCISYPYINELLKKVQFHSDDVFVDVGCAWGRLIATLDKKTNIKKYYGIEINKAVANKAIETFKSNPNVTVICDDILNSIPCDATVFYLFNPFDETILEQFLERLERLEMKNIRIMYLYPTCEKVFNNRKRWFLSEIIVLKPKYMGELKMNVYYLID